MAVVGGAVGCPVVWLATADVGGCWVVAGADEVGFTNVLVVVGGARVTVVEGPVT